MSTRLATGGKKLVVEYEPDTHLRDSEQVPLLEDGGIAASIEREVFPYTPDAWVDGSKTQIGYEIFLPGISTNPFPCGHWMKSERIFLPLSRKQKVCLERSLWRISDESFRNYYLQGCG